MKGFPTTILLMLSLVVAGLLSAAVAEDVDTIRLPNDSQDAGLADQVMAAMMTKGVGRRPWKCCDLPLCTRSAPPVCRCLDKVEKCARSCEHCEQASSDPTRYSCNEWYGGWPGPKCAKDGDDDGLVDHVATATATSAAEDNADATRPWKCCDAPLCTRSFPPSCRCLDTVNRCASACKNCEEKEGGFVCKDKYKGFDQGPKCAKGCN